MCNILNIETATNVCSVSVSSSKQVIFEKLSMEGPSHAALLGLFVKDAIEQVKNAGITLNAVAVSCGPGSYTGLRIGVSEAKGLCYGLNIPLIAIKTPLIMAEAVLHARKIADDELLCPMIDARRMEVYTAIYDKELNIVRDISAEIVDSEIYKSYLDKNKVLFFGNGADKCKGIIVEENAIFIENIYPQASYMARLSYEAYISNQFVDTAYFEPFYLKDFIATTSKKNIF